MTHPLDGPLGKIERANDHFADLQAEIGEFLAREPYGLFTEVDRDSGQNVVRVRVREEPPDRIAAIVGDLAHNLRSAWDYLAQQLVIANHATPDTKTEFPVFWDSEEYKASAGRKIRGMSEDAVRVIELLQPYQAAARGADPEYHFLYVIHGLDKRDKHVDWAVVGSALAQYVLGVPPPGGWPEGATIHIDSASAAGSALISPLKDGAEVLRIRLGPATNVDVDSQATFAVAFDKAGVGKGQPVIPLCKQLIDASKRGIEEFRPLLARP